MSYTKYTENDEKDDFEEMPVTIVGDLEQYQLPAAIWIHRLPMFEYIDFTIMWIRLTYRERHGSNESTEEASPHGFYTEIARHFLKPLSAHQGQ